MPTRSKFGSQSPEDFEAPDQDLMAAAVDLLAVEGMQAETVGLLRKNNFPCVLPLALGASSPRPHQLGRSASSASGWSQQFWSLPSCGSPRPLWASSSGVSASMCCRASCQHTSF